MFSRVLNTQGFQPLLNLYYAYKNGSLMLFLVFGDLYDCFKVNLILPYTSPLVFMTTTYYIHIAMRVYLQL